MAPAFHESRWYQLTEEMTVGMRDWRTQHPTAPLREMEERDRVAKRALYSELGVQEYWIVDRFQRQVGIDRPVEGVLQMVACQSEDETITSPLLPGFVCTPADLLEA